jgi:thiamine pyrophosphate-dependent acetolactate synthase large subunit-like protein
VRPVTPPGGVQHDLLSARGHAGAVENESVVAAHGDAGHGAGSTDETPDRRVGAGPRLKVDAIVCGDSGQNTLYAARYIKIQAQQRFSCSGLLATMGSALPYAIGAQFAFP